MNSRMTSSAERFWFGLQGQVLLLRLAACGKIEIDDSFTGSAWPIGGERTLRTLASGLLSDHRLEIRRPKPQCRRLSQCPKSTSTNLPPHRVLDGDVCVYHGDRWCVNGPYHSVDDVYVDATLRAFGKPGDLLFDNRRHARRPRVPR